MRMEKGNYLYAILLKCPPKEVMTLDRACAEGEVMPSPK
jgi:hypothetical protein